MMTSHFKGERKSTWPCVKIVIALCVKSLINCDWPLFFFLFWKAEFSFTSSKNKNKKINNWIRNGAGSTKWLHRPTGRTQRWKRHKMCWGATNIKTAPDSWNIYQSIICIYFTQNLTLFYSMSLARNIILFTETLRWLPHVVWHRRKHHLQKRGSICGAVGANCLLTAEHMSYEWYGHIGWYDNQTAICTPDSGAPLMAMLAVVQYEGKNLCGFAAKVTETSGAMLPLKTTLFSATVHCGCVPIVKYCKSISVEQVPSKTLGAQKIMCISRVPTQMTSKSLKSNSRTLDHLLLLCRFHQNELNQSTV